MGQVILDTLNSFGIKEKVITIRTDNSKSMTDAVRFTGIKRIPCFDVKHSAIEPFEDDTGNEDEEIISKSANL